MQAKQLDNTPACATRPWYFVPLGQVRGARVLRDEADNGSNSYRQICYLCNWML